MKGIKHMNLIEISPVVIEIQEVELAVPVNNTSVCHTQLSWPLTHNRVS